jgi:hypothetical protein
MLPYSIGIDEKGIVYLRLYSGLVQLTKNQRSWHSCFDSKDMPAIKVRLLQPGEKVTLEND